MKQQLLFALLLSGTLHAQLTITADTVSVGIDNTVDVVAKNTVVNTDGETRTFDWERNIVTLEPGWTTAVCDVNLCYLPSVGSQSFELNANQEGTLDVHVYPNGNAEGSAVIEITVTQADDTDNTLTGVFVFDSSITTSTRDLQQLNFRVFPNPNTGLFRIEGSDARAATLEVYSTTGQLLTRYSVVHNNWYDLANLGSGNYLLRLTDREGTQLGSKFVTKL